MFRNLEAEQARFGFTNRGMAEKLGISRNAICSWIQAELKETGTKEQSMILPEMTKALAELVSARGNKDAAGTIRRLGDEDVTKTVFGLTGR